MTTLALGFLLGACGGGGGEPERISIEATPNGAQLAVEATLQYAAVVKDARGNVLTGRPVTWSSSNPSVVSISSSGLALGMAPGTATISASSGDSTANVAVTTDNVNFIWLRPQSNVVRPGASTLFAGRVFGQTTTGELIATINWAVADLAVASISANGTLTGLTPGTTTVTATVGSKAFSTEVSVQEPVSGLISFTSDRDDAGGVYMMRTDGSAPTRLLADRTVIGGACGATPDPFRICHYRKSAGRFAPDGLRIAITDEWQFDPEQKGWRILTCATANPVCMEAPWPSIGHPLERRTFLGQAWSPDGSRLAFYGNLGLFVSNSGDETHWVPARVGPGGAQMPAWSPDGTRIAFASGPFSSPAGELWIMNADGSQPVQLTNSPGGFESWPRWSPDGSKIAYTTNVDGNDEIYVINTDGSAPTNLTNSPAQDGGPAWSRDGTKIAFHTNRDGNFEIYTMNADGTGLVNLTANPASDMDPDWSP